MLVGKCIVRVGKTSFTESTTSETTSGSMAAINNISKGGNSYFDLYVIAA